MVPDEGRPRTEGRQVHHVRQEERVARRVDEGEQAERKTDVEIAVREDWSSVDGAGGAEEAERVEASVGEWTQLLYRPQATVRGADFHAGTPFLGVSGPSRPGAEEEKYSTARVAQL